MSRIGRRHPRSRKLLGIIATAALGATMVAGVTTSSAATVNLIRNGDFETGIDGWSAEKGGTLEHSNDGFGDSEHSLAIVNRTTTQSSPFYKVTDKINEGDTVRINAKLKYDEGDDNKSFSFTLCPTNFDDDVCEDRKCVV